MKKQLFISALILASELAHAEVPPHFQNWVVGSSPAVNANTPAFTFTATNNVGGDMLGEYCYKGAGGHCEWRLSTHVSCVKDTESVVMVNASAFVLIKTQCIGALSTDGSYTSRLVGWEDLESLLSTSDQIAFVVPMQNSAIYVARFSCAGVIQASAYIGGPIVGERHYAPPNHTSSSNGSEVL